MDTVIDQVPTRQIPVIANRTGWPWRATAAPFPRTMSNGAPWPKLTIITPSYNQAAFLEETIRSVQLQGYPNLEYMVLDGGSTDGSVEIIRKYESHLAYWVSERDRGQAHAINKGLERATGELVGWVNSDDMYVEGAFRHVVEAFADHPDCVLVHGNRIMLDAASRVCGWTALPSFDPESSGFNVCSETAFWRLSGGTDAPLRDELRFAMDLELFCRFYKVGKFFKTDAYLGYFRCHGDNKTSQIPEVCRLETEREWKAIFGERHEGWRLRRSLPRWQQVYSLLQNPKLIALPYLHRRFVLGQRGL